MIRKRTRNLKRLSLNAPWNCVTNRYQKPRRWPVSDGKPGADAGCVAALSVAVIGAQANHRRGKEGIEKLEPDIDARDGPAPMLLTNFRDLDSQATIADSRR